MTKILFVASEAFPLVKTGGLGDVCGSLPDALIKNQQDVRVLLPAYRNILEQYPLKKRIASSHYHGLDVEIYESRLPGTRVIVWLVHCAAVYDRPGGPYIDQHGQAWHDNALRFSILCHAGVDLALDTFSLSWKPDIVHCHDWQTGLIPALLSLKVQRPKTVFTIHNLAYQGVFDRQTFEDLHLPSQLWAMDGVEYYNQLSFMKGGLCCADKITTVSEHYATEILSPEFGYGLSGLLQHRHKDIHGILNGIDTRHWNPGTDQHLVQKYNKRNLDRKTLNKTALQRELSISVNENMPLLGLVSRLVQQKGLDIILPALTTLLKQDIQLVILGTGDLHYEIQLVELARKYPGKFKVIIGYDEALSHRIEAACDIFLMPSVFEPCGLNQMYSLRYGTLPIVTPVGGLADTVLDASAENIKNSLANGFVLDEVSSDAFIRKVEQSLTLYQQKETWKKLQLCAMSQDHSWKNSAAKYIDLYQSLLKD